jgi:monovalent cation/hydrogen antiporter
MAMLGRSRDDIAENPGSRLMAGDQLHTTQIILLLLLVFVAGFATLAQKLKTPYPIVLVIAGLLLGFVPGIPKVTLNPELIFLVVLPPLLYAAAWVTSWRDFVENSVSIASLAVGLVAFTVVAVAAAASWFFPGFDWRLGFVLGAAVATTDAIAATSIAKRIGLPKRIVDILEGESLLNDATGLLALEFGTAMVVYGQTPTIGFGLLRFLYLGGVGIGVGLLLGLIIEWIERRIDDGNIEIAISIFVPYAAYMSAEAMHASGILAVVAAGLYLGSHSSRFFSPSVRLQANAVWNSLTFILNGLVFVLIGLQLPYVLSGIRESSIPKLIGFGAAFSVFLIVLRLLWTFPSAHAAYFIRTRLLHEKQERPEARRLFVVGWTGMRGVIALAAAISLPQTLANGSPFPHRNLIVFLTFSVILVTLVLQGLTLPVIIRMLGLAGGSSPHSKEEEARRLVLEAALDHLEQRRRKDEAQYAGMYDDIAQHYRHRLASMSGNAEPGSVTREQYAHYLEVSRELVGVERRAALDLHRQGRIGSDVTRELEQELDLNETRLRAAIKHRELEV